MAEIKPFCALRFRTQKAGDISSLTCPPYDIISESQRNEYLAKNPYNVIRLELPKGENPYEQAEIDLHKWEELGILKQDTEPAVYIYEEEFLDGVTSGNTCRVKGIICRVKLEDFSNGVILPHEETLSKAKQDRFNLMKTTHCNFSQIYSLYTDPQHTTRNRMDALSSSAPRFEFSDGLVTHRLWIVNDPVAIKAFCEDFAQRKLYIADGHHRYETALNFRNECRSTGLCPEGGDADYIMMMLVDMEHEGLVVFPTHRLIRGIDDFNADKLKSGCKEFFETEEKDGLESIEPILQNLYSEGKKAFAFYAGGNNWTLLTLKNKDVMKEILQNKSEAYRELDVTILHSLILERLMGIDKENMANQKNLTYTRSFDEAISSVQNGESRCAFILNPTRVTEIKYVAAAGEKMPQKSTYFYPKLITGLVMNQMNF